MNRKKLRLFLVVAIMAVILFGVVTYGRTAVALVNSFIARPTNNFQVNFTTNLELVAEGFDNPVHLAHANDGSGRLFVVEKPGRVQIVQGGKTNPDAYLDIVSKVGSRGYEQGLLSVAFHPNYKDNGFLYVNYTDLRGDTIIARYNVSADNPELTDADSEKVLLKIDQPYPNHNGGLIRFGPDGYLYIGMGDGGAAGDPLRAGQDKFNLLGKLLRIDVDNGDPYGIPSDNPFADGAEGAKEVWAYGLRNPWKFSFDRETGDLYIADVGQNAYEEIHFQKAGTPGGLNFGWNIMEGNHCYPPGSSCDTSKYEPAIAEYGHGLGISVTGGYVYRGEKYPVMHGVYFFADFGTSRTWGLKQAADGQWEMSELFLANFQVSSFGEDEAGELYMLDFSSGKIYQLTAK